MFKPGDKVRAIRKPFSYEYELPPGSVFVVLRVNPASACLQFTAQRPLSPCWYRFDRFEKVAIERNLPSWF